MIPVSGQSFAVRHLQELLCLFAELGEGNGIASYVQPGPGLLALSTCKATPKAQRALRAMNDGDTDKPAGQLRGPMSNWQYREAQGHKL